MVSVSALCIEQAVLPGLAYAGTDGSVHISEYSIHVSKGRI